MFEKNYGMRVNEHCSNPNKTSKQMLLGAHNFLCIADVSEIYCIFEYE